jgi:biotin carboxylase
MTEDRGRVDSPLLLLVGTGMRVYREYLLRSISTRFRVHLFTTTEPDWEREYLHGWTVMSSTLDGRAMASLAGVLNLEEPVCGVLCWDESRIHATAYVAQALGLPNGDPAAIWRLRDKAQTRAALAASGVPQPRSVPVKTLDQALAAAEGIGYPVVLKPRGLGASLGVVRADDPAELRGRFAFTRDTRPPEPVVYASDEPVLVEECVTGIEISVDSAVQHGVVTPLFIARKVVGYPPYAEEVGHLVDAADPLFADAELMKVVQEAHRALHFTDGMTHSEYMLTSSGPKVIEVNGRLGGDMIPYLGQLANGIDAGLAAAAIACGIQPDLTPTHVAASGIRFFYVKEKDTTIDYIHFDADDLSAAIDRAVTVAHPGATVSPPPEGTVWGRVAFAIAFGDSVDECLQALDRAEKALEIGARPRTA